MRTKTQNKRKKHRRLRVFVVAAIVLHRRLRTRNVEEEHCASLLPGGHKNIVSLLIRDDSDLGFPPETNETGCRSTSRTAEREGKMRTPIPSDFGGTRWRRLERQRTQHQPLTTSEAVAIVPAGVLALAVSPSSFLVATTRGYLKSCYRWRRRRLFSRSKLRLVGFDSIRFSLGNSPAHPLTSSPCSGVLTLYPGGYCSLARYSFSWLAALVVACLADSSSFFAWLLAFLLRFFFVSLVADRSSHFRRAADRRMVLIVPLGNIKMKAQATNANSNWQRPGEQENDRSRVLSRRYGRRDLLLRLYAQNNGKRPRPNSIQTAELRRK